MPAIPSVAETVALVHRAAARERRVLLVQGEHAAAQALVLKRAAQQAGRGDGPAVVGEAQRAPVAQLHHVGQLLAGQPARDRGHEADRHARLARGRRAQGRQALRRVQDGIGVGHRHDRAVAAGRRGPRAGLEVLLVLLAGRAQVHVRVDERREQVAPRALDVLGAGRGRGEPGAPIAAISPLRTTTSSGSSRPVRGSSTWAPRISRSASGGPGRG